MRKLLFSTIAVYVLISTALNTPAQAMQEQTLELSVLTSPTERAEFYSNLMVNEMRAGNFERAQNIFAQWRTRSGFAVDYLIPSLSHNSILHWVAMEGNPALVQDVINAGAQVNSRNNNGSTPLHLAIKYNSNQEVITTLLNAGADINAINTSGNTPLHHALKYTDIQAVKILLAHPNVNIEAKDRNGRTPLQFFLHRQSKSSYTQQSIVQIKKLLAPHLMTLKKIVIDHIVTNSDYYKNHLQQLPLDLQKTIFKELVRRLKT